LRHIFSFMTERAVEEALARLNTAQRQAVLQTGN
jgi:hypothetical protein